MNNHGCNGNGVHLDMNEPCNISSIILSCNFIMISTINKRMQDDKRIISVDD